MKLAIPQRRRFRITPAEVARHIALVILVFLSLFPIYYILVNSPKDVVQYAQNPWFFPSEPHWENYAKAWTATWQPVVNSIFIVLISVFAIVLLAALTAYAFAQIRFPGKSFLFMAIFVLLLIPGFLTLIPLYLQIKRIGLTNSPWGLILPYVAGGQAFSIVVLRTFFSGLATELIEAAKIDGASDLRVFTSIALPLSMPVLISVGIINLIPIWNDYLLPQLVLDRSHRTLTMALVALQGSAQSHTSTNFGTLMASYAISAIPLLVLFAFTMRYYIAGLSSGAVK